MFQRILIVVVLILIASFLYHRSTDSLSINNELSVRGGATTAPIEDQAPILVTGDLDAVVEPSKNAVSALDRKKAQAKNNAETATGLSETELDQELRFAKDVMSAGASTERVLSQWYSDNLNAHGANEADFRLALALNSSNWDEQMKMVADRASALGTIGSGAYDQLLLDLGIRNGQISFDEVKALSDRGSTIPDDVVYSLASKGRVDLIAELSQSSLLANPNYEQPILGRNAVGALIEHATFFPGQYESPQAARKAISTLIDLGVVPVSVNGGLDPLDDTLTHISDRNFEIKYAIAQRLLEHGVPVEQSHRELVSMLPAGTQRKKLEELLAINSNE